MRIRHPIGVVAWDWGIPPRFALNKFSPIKVRKTRSKLLAQRRPHSMKPQSYRWLHQFLWLRMTPQLSKLWSRPGCQDYIKRATNLNSPTPTKWRTGSRSLWIFFSGMLGAGTGYNIRACFGGYVSRFRISHISSALSGEF